MENQTYLPIKGKACRIMWAQRDPQVRRSGLGNLCIKNIEGRFEPRSLWEICSMFGPVLSLKIPSGKDGKPLNYAYVQYESENAAKLAAEHLNSLDEENTGKAIVVETYIRRVERPKVWTNIYFKNIPASWTSETLSAICQPFGKVTSVEVPKGADGKTKGYGFCNFENQNEAEACVTALNDRDVYEDPAIAVKALTTPDYKDDKAEVSSKKLFAGRFKTKTERQRESREQYALLRNDTSKLTNLYVRNLPSESFDDEALRKLFAPYGSITSCKVVVDPSTKLFKGYGYVAFATREEAENAKSKLHNHIDPVTGKRLYVSWHEAKDIRGIRIATEKARTPNQQSGRNYNAGGNNMQNMNQNMGNFGGMNMFGMPNQMAMQQYNPQLALMMLQMMQQMNPQQMGFMAPPLQNLQPGQQPNASQPGQARNAGPQMGGNARPQQQISRGPVQTSQPGQQQPGQQQGQPQQRQPFQQQGPGMQQPRQFQQPSGGYATAVSSGRPGVALMSNAVIPPNMNVGQLQQPQQQGQVQQQQVPPQQRQQQQQAQAKQQQSSDSNLLSILSNAPKEEHRNILGERLYPRIQQHNPNLAGKITGMLLELDTAEVINLLSDAPALSAKIEEAVQLLKQSKYAPQGQ